MENIRRYDMDWLRVIVFALLIFYHVGMFFVPWGWHIKNPEIYPALKWPMLFINQWRLAILFVISGMGTFYALNKRTGKQFINERFIRLFIPLVVGVLLVVPPQVYIERLINNQFSGSYFAYWPAEIFNGIYPTGNFSWHHLWFLPYLLLFSILLSPVFQYLKGNPESSILRKTRKLLTKPLSIFVFIIPLYLWEAFLEPFFPSTHSLWGDWFNLINYITFFFFGFLLVSLRDQFWNYVEKNRKIYLFTGVLSFLLQLIIWLFFEDSIIIHFTEALVKVTNLWAWILTLFGFGAAYLNKPSNSLKYANEAVYPFYILHQTIMIILGYYMLHWEAGFWIKFTAMTIGTFGFSFIIYEFGIRRWSFVRPLFGLKSKPNRKKEPVISDQSFA